MSKAVVPSLNVAFRSVPGVSRRNLTTPPLLLAPAICKAVWPYHKCIEVRGKEVYWSTVNTYLLAPFNVHNIILGF